MAKQSSLFAFGFTKKVKHREEWVQVETSKKPIGHECDLCKKLLKTTQALSMHVAWCSSQKQPAHKSNNSTQSEITTINAKPSDIDFNIYLSENMKEDDILSDVSYIIEKLITTVESNVLFVPSKKKRMSYTNEYKMKVLEDLNDRMKHTDVAKKYNVNRSLITKWKSDENVIYHQNAASLRHALFKKNRRSTKHRELFTKLFEKFSVARRSGLKVCFQWLYVNANKIYHKDYPSSNLPKSIVTSFLRKYKITLRRVQRKKQKDNHTHVPSLMRWHSNLREGLVKTGKDKPHYDPKWGRFSPGRRLNVDQVPLPFCIDRKTTYEASVPRAERREHRVWVSQPGSGLEKRQASLQLCFGPKTIVRPALIFRGTGKRITPDEIMAYHKEVDVYWQTNAWADTAFCTDWANNTLKEAVSRIGEYVLFCDNLNGQISPLFQEAIRSSQGIAWYGVPNATHLWQPVDAGYGKLYKRMIHQEQDDWLQFDENLELWLGNSSETLSAKQRRILLTQWVGEAHCTIVQSKYDKFRYDCFQRTGCLITADGSEDDKIKPETLTHYIVPPPVDVEVPNKPMEQSIPTPATAEPDIQPDSEVDTDTEGYDVSGDDLVVDFDEEMEIVLTS